VSGVGAPRARSGRGREFCGCPPVRAVGCSAVDQPLPPSPFPSAPCLCSYGQALAAVTVARTELDRLGVPYRRPDDYFAAMLKSDDHMKKVRA